MKKLKKLFEKLAIRRIKRILTNAGITFEKGLSNEEFQKIESVYGIVFPPDLKSIYRNFLPISNQFYNWRDFSDENIEKIKRQIYYPIDGIMFDIERNDFWIKDFGEKSGSITTDLENAKKYMEKNVPILIPIFGHRYISSYPCEANNPIYSVVQTDIIYYGNNIYEYFEVEFANKKLSKKSKRYVPFWGEIAS